jgi:tripeptide aminopeptidase
MVAGEFDRFDTDHANDISLCGASINPISSFPESEDTMRHPVALALFLSSLLTTGAAQSHDGRFKDLLQSAGIGKANAFIEADYDRFVRELITLTEIPAPPFKEAARAKAFANLVRDAGLSDVELDEEGNVLGLRKGGGKGLLAVVAHLDTVFPGGTDVKVKRDGTKLLAPGVSDDSRGLAVMLAAVRAINGAGIDTDADLLFVGSVGEEGEGDLRGVRYLFDKGKYKDRITAFLTIDGPDPRRLVNGALGSKRYRVTFKGPGGHSYNAFGLVSPAFAMADAIHRLGALKVPPKTTFNVGVVSGGTSVNSIPVEMSMDVDVRSESPAELDKVSLAFATMVRDAVEAENKTRSTAQGRLTADTLLIGDRPSGETSIESPFIQRVAAAMRAFGLKPNYEFQSSDTNIPISREIPAGGISHGGIAGRHHSLDEWTDVEKTSSVRATQFILATIVSLATD